MIWEMTQHLRAHTHLEASASAARWNARRASSAFSCTGALESATVFLNNGPNHHSRRIKHWTSDLAPKKTPFISPKGMHESRKVQIRTRNGADREAHGGCLTELAEAGVLGVGDRVAERGEVDVRVIPHLPVLMLQPLVPRQLLRLLEELLVLRRHGRTPPPPRAGSVEREALETPTRFKAAA